MPPMEKQEKIEKGQNRRFRLFTAALVGTIFVGGVYVVVHAPDDAKQSMKQMTSMFQSEQELLANVQSLDAKVRKIKKTGVFTEVDPEARIATKQLQDATRLLLAKRYGRAEPYRVQLDLEFQPTIPDYDEKGPDGTLVFEMAPSSLVPHSIYTFLEVARRYKGGGFHRNAPHVLQVLVEGGGKIGPLAFQEYSPQWPHKKGTVGYAGRPSGPAWYVSIQDNTKIHGPGTQQKHNPYEADSCFGKVVEGFDDVVMKRITKMPGREFINDPKKHVLIKSMHILVPGDGPDGYVEWQPQEEEESR